MTIAACFLSSEGVVLGADSSSSIAVPGGGFHHLQQLEHTQKLFQIGERGTLGVVSWGIGQLGDKPYRTLAAELSDAISSGSVNSFDSAIEWWRDATWSLFEQQFGPIIKLTQDLISKKTTIGLSPPEQKQLEELLGVAGGFCIAGCFLPSRTPRAFEVSYGPILDRGTSVKELAPAPTWRFWGCPNITDRIIIGIDAFTKQKILNSGKWSGSVADLDALSQGLKFEPYAQLPLREAVDWVFAMIYATIKAFKFSTFPPLCGGPIDIAVITSDRPFRWVRHKRFGAAIARDEYQPRGEI